MSRTINGVTTSYAYDGWNLIEDYDGAGNELARYIHGPQSDDILAKISPTGAVYYIQDGNHNVTAITDGTGAVQERYSYDVYGTATITDAAGNVLTVSGQGNRFMFTGREFVSQIGLYDYRNRVYSATLGRFLQTDPIRFEAGDINIYRYVGNGPVSGTDPMGLCPFNPAYNPGLGNNNVLGGGYAPNLPGGTDPGANFKGLGIAALGAAAIATGGEALVAAAPAIGALATAGFNAAVGYAIQNPQQVVNAANNLGNVIEGAIYPTPPSNRAQLLGNIGSIIYNSINP
ncbi:MAG: RHS repeat-associated core domain-containing protein [Verrucomicrobia bacterium]|nr:RHS repeat-associated core domain-containing protein [Verrucomicrobiota bacterium]